MRLSMAQLTVWQPGSPVQVIQETVRSRAAKMETSVNIAHCDFCSVLFVKNESLSPAHNQGERNWALLLGGVAHQRIYGHNFKITVISELGLPSSLLPPHYFFPHSLLLSPTSEKDFFFTCWREEEGVHPDLIPGKDPQKARLITSKYAINW